MKATITSKGQITIPVRIRRKLDLRPGDELVFDEEAPYLKAVRAFDIGRMRAVIGRGKKRLAGLSSEEWLNQTRGNPPIE